MASFDRLEFTFSALATISALIEIVVIKRVIIMKGLQWIKSNTSDYWNSIIFKAFLTCAPKQIEF